MGKSGCEDKADVRRFAPGVCVARVGVALALVLFLFPAGLQAAPSMGPHDDGSGNPCKRCHDTAEGVASLRGWTKVLPLGDPGTVWGKNVSGLCYYCHDGLGLLGATNMINNAYANTSHGFVYDTTLPSPLPRTPDGLLTSGSVTASGLPYTSVASMELECTSCHNVHTVDNRPYSQRATFEALCDSCHPGRINSDSATSYPGYGIHAYETHPTRQVLEDTSRANLKDVAGIDAALKTATPALWALGGHLADAAGDTGVFDCQTCHSVHGPAQGTAGLPGLLAVDNTTAATGSSALCEGCHFGGAAGEQVGSVVLQSALPPGEWSDHPMDSANNLVSYPTGTVIPDSSHVPVDWGAANPNGDGGAQALNTAAADGATPVCSSCHDTHGGLSGTPLLRGPSVNGGGSPTWTFSYDEWCFVCHVGAELMPRGHHSVINNLSEARGDSMDSQLSCGDCHGAAANLTEWKAHNGFWVFVTPASPTDSAVCEGCHIRDNPLEVIPGGLKGLSAPDLLTTPIATPSSHGTVRGTASHWLGADTDEFAGVVPWTDAWPTSENAGFPHFSEYGSPNTGGGGNVQPVSAGAIICESCHNVTYNDGRARPGNYSTPESAGWESNLLLEPYEDDGVGAGSGSGANAVGSALCTGCHTGSGNHHPLTGDIVSLSGLALRTGSGSYADQNAGPTTGGAAPGTLSYPNSNALDCDSCHRPHQADNNSTTPPGFHGPGSISNSDPTYHILEVDAAGHVFTPTLCQECHLK